MLKFFIAREYLFAVEREAIPQNADPAFEQQALAYLEKALQLNPKNARPYIGLGSLYLKQAKRLIKEAADSEYTDQSFQEIMQLLDRAEAAYGRVLQVEIDPAEYGVPVKDIARLGLSDVKISRGLSWRGYANSDPGREEFQEAMQLLDQAIHTLNDVLPAFQASSLVRYLAQS